MPRRIAILLTNTDDSAFARGHPDDAHKVAAMLRPLRPDWTFDCFSAKDGRLPPEDDRYDGVVITGSVASVNDDAPWIAALADRVAALLAARVPMVGLCFGHQLIARVLGGRVGANPHGLRVGVVTTRFTAVEPWMRPPAPTLALFAAHQEQVLALPAQARVLGGDPGCPVGAFAVGDHVLTTQYHPELSPDFMAGLLEAFAPAFGPAVTARARGQIGQPVDAALFAQWVVQFLEKPREAR